MRVVQIASEVNVGSIGSLAEAIGNAVLAGGGESFIAYGRSAKESTSCTYRIGNTLDIYGHGLYTRLTDKHGLASCIATRNLCRWIEAVNPDIIHLHHLHGYFINYEILFEYLKRCGKPVVWTMHDCWSFTGHCTHYEHAGCLKWQAECSACPQSAAYPSAWVDRSTFNYLNKKKHFTALSALHLVPVSHWMEEQLAASFLQKIPRKVIHNGIDVSVFNPDAKHSANHLHTVGKTLLLGVAHTWKASKGAAVFLQLAAKLPQQYHILLVGADVPHALAKLNNITSVGRITQPSEMARYYASADIYINPTENESFGLTSVEAMACGTPVIAYRVGGVSEIVTPETGILLDKNQNDLFTAIDTILAKEQLALSDACVNRARSYFTIEKTVRNYLTLYNEVA